MQRIIKTLFVIICLGFMAPLSAAVTANNDFFSGSVVNRTGTVIRFMPNDNGVWIGLTHGDDSHMFWETMASVKIKLQGLANERVYVTICPDIQYINAGETITVSVRNPNEERQFYCEVEPAVG